MAPTGRQSVPPTAPEAPAPRSELIVRGMTCVNCQRHVTEAIQSVPGVSHAAVSLETGRVQVHWAPAAPVNVEAVLAAVDRAGYKAEPVAGPEPEAAEAAGEPPGSGAEPKSEPTLDPLQAPRQRQAGWEWNLWIGIPATAPLLLGEWILGWGDQLWFRWLALGLASLVQVLAGARFYRGAWSQLKVGRSNMDTLVALGSSTAYGYSLWALWAGGGHLYFLESAAIITLISLGHWLEARASARAASAVRALMQLAPATARRRLPDGSEQLVPVATVKAGEWVWLKPGDRVPVDGQVVQGASAVDESMLTGESMPVDKAAGAPLYAGTLNLTGQLLLRVTATGEATALAQVIAAVQRAQASRARIQRLADRVSNVFVPIVVAAALAAGLWWGLGYHSARSVHQRLSVYLWPTHLPDTPSAAAIIIAAAVLIIACPCAMGLATPAAIMAGCNAAARRGILIRDAVALEKAGRITTVVFDKTGTLTVGRPTVVQTHVLDTPGLADAAQALRLAATLARGSNHPFSQAVVRLAADSEPITAWREVHGAGLEALWLTKGNAPVRLGSLNWLTEQGTDCSAGSSFVETATARGASVIGLAVGQRLAALLALMDPTKPKAPEVVRQLQRQGLRLYLVTGDNPRTATSIAAAVGLSPQQVRAQAQPEAKVQFVQQLQRSGQRVAFVGDGINDAPALEQADLGIAVGRASDIAQEAADILLLKSEIEAVPESLGLARATLRVIRQNLFWAFFYNAAAVPLAALGFLSPIVCAAAMALSDLVVIGNALRLLRSRPKNA